MQVEGVAMVDWWALTPAVAGLAGVVLGRRR
jgi:hypothetical protein